MREREERELLGIAINDIPIGSPLWRSDLGSIYAFDELPDVASNIVLKSLSLRSTGPIARRDDVWIDLNTGRVFGTPPRRPEPKPETWRDRPPLL